MVACPECGLPVGQGSRRRLGWEILWVMVAVGIILWVVVGMHGRGG